ncbi:MAG: GreA/GreB family elongation factor [Nitrospinota bacterium]|jgi:transcription elongation GreA/GreB family factor|nr:GreA/GreB family elongation factor [Nitrospinota bacterium]MDP6366454.1 GreA/GreB family elongation factor [Nitrospinota bacterium]MDP7167414.1 GreA/GreB family elongation factor [Nitrospinota bacterium]MDP7371433.1 GreA/GreB family elongation factor [Nitrospinota bacterium]MDP7503589.1 GreA/GreB family elongation factor [Nitrospinota bacterium]
MPAFYTTKASLDLMREKVEGIQHRLKTEVAQELAKAADYGDLSENSEWEAALEMQSNLKHEAGKLMGKIQEAELIEDLPIAGDRVTIGTEVTLFDLDKDEELTYKILGEQESDFQNGILSFQAPLVRGLMQKEPGDEVQVKLPSGTRNFEIVDVKKIEFP